MRGEGGKFNSNEDDEAMASRVVGQKQIKLELGNGSATAAAAGDSGGPDLKAGILSSNARGYAGGGSADDSGLLSTL